MIRHDVSLYSLHFYLQTIMGWTNSHLHEFGKGSSKYVNYLVEPFDKDDELIYYYDLNLSDLMTTPGDELLYIYDFGDYWVHQLRLLEICHLENESSDASCINGENACPPEDVGGMHEFLDLLEILKNKRHPEYRDYKSWLPKNYLPNYFSAENINEFLKLPNCGFPIDPSETKEFAKEAHRFFLRNFPNLPKEQRFKSTSALIRIYEDFSAQDAYEMMKPKKFWKIVEKINSKK